ncbi:MAG: hypothetical protein PHV99_00640 [Candidatus Pacebacteria bacterium]|nr:hypothetical protein [Candidatus Paceibacterota bacterium]
MIPFFETIVGWRDFLKDKYGIRLEPRPLFILGLVLLFMSYVFMPSVVSLALSLALFLAPVWLPFLLIGGAVKVWLIWRRGEFIASQKYILLEIRPPRNLVKTPLAMEAFLSTLHLGPGEGTWYVRWIKGAVRPWWSLEIASLEGQVHFYIWTKAGFRRMIETQLYAQYPGIQVVEALDYTRLISATTEDYGIWGCDFKHTAKKQDALPIKTYVEYGLDKAQKEPEQVDPLANLIEFMGSVGKGEYLWLQMVFRMHKGEKYDKLNAAGKAYTWVDEAKELVDKIRKETREPYKDPVSGKEIPGFPNPTKGQIEKIAAIERNVSKQGFDVGMRCIYLAREGYFNPVVISQMNALFNPFNSAGWNGIGASDWMRHFDDYPWEIGAEKLKNTYRRLLVEAFRRRQFFFEPFGFGISPKDTMVMSTEELATVFHIPSRAVETPGLGRIQSATGEAPPNLPV